MFTSRKLLLWLVTLPMSVQAQVIGSDTALLVQLLSTTVSQLNELEKLVSNAEKYTERIKVYNELVQDEYFKAERVLYLAESLAAKSENLDDLGDLNLEIRRLRNSMEEFDRLIDDYQMVRVKEQRNSHQIQQQKKLNSKKERMAQNQVEKSIYARNTGRASQLTAQNTGLLYENSVQMHTTQLEILEKLSKQNEMQAEAISYERQQDKVKSSFYGQEKSPVSRYE